MSIGTSNEVLFNDGEGLVLTDLMNMQRFVRAMIKDQHLGQHGSYNGQEGLLPTGSLSPYALTPSARGGYVKPTGTARQITNAPGILCQWGSSSAPDGLTPQLLTYQLAQDELQTTVGANSSGNPRIDALCVKLSLVAADSQTRDFEDATTHALTSATFNKRNEVSLAISLVPGTPGASPVAPAIPSGYCLYAYVYVPNGAGVLTHDQVWDQRLPMKLGRKKIYAKSAIDLHGDWVLSGNGFYVQNTGTFGGGVGFDYFSFFLGLGSDQRLMRASLHGAWATGAGMFAEWARMPASSMGTYTIPGVGSGALGFALGPGASGSAAVGNQALPTVYAFSSVTAPAAWGNGWPSGFGAESVGDAAHSSTDLVAKVTDTSQTDTLDISWIEVYYLF